MQELVGGQDAFWKEISHDYWNFIGVSFDTSFADGNGDFRVFFQLTLLQHGYEYMLYFARKID
jgi:hypothetical protein